MYREGRPVTQLSFYNAPNSREKQGLGENIRRCLCLLKVVSFASVDFWPLDLKHCGTDPESRTPPLFRILESS